ncbi:hypothetical protein AAFC00_004881 [Neodothiora populina]|uniref:Exocyst complex component Sec3 PIP2-binding N-terminal domain-containing protein n=1 Tax=Neodothiora populina TaxID=2781224 RepID=A0ABR3P4W0_9PEZI
MNGNHHGYSPQPRIPSDVPSQSSRRPSQTPMASSHTTGMSRAERFEDEKRRLIETCFSKVDSSGQLSESYITHIRVQEDAAHPSTPAPPTSDPKNKKPRVVVIAVRSSGRVRMHKARENSNASFSIGKTWNLEDLTAIESFTHQQPHQDPRREQYREWAGAIGFVVTISKPYYWQAGTSKEKDFFIASLVKIYRKYTKGQVPELKGFTDREIEAVLGLMPGQQPSPRPTADPRAAAAASAAAGGPPPPRLPYAESNRTGSSDSRDPRQRPMNREPPPRPPPESRQLHSQDTSAHPSSRYESPNDPARRPRRLNSKDQGLRQAPSRERLARPSGEQLRPPPSRDAARPSSNQSSASGPFGHLPPSGARLTPKSSHSELRPIPMHGNSPAPSTTSSSISRLTTPQTQPHPPPPHPLPLKPVERQMTNPSTESLPTPNTAMGASLFNATVDRWKPSTSPQPSPTDLSPQRQRPRPLEEQPQPQPMPLQLREPGPPTPSGREFSYEVQAPPERKRPPMQTRDYNPLQRTPTSESADLRPPPLAMNRPSSAGRNQPPSPAAPVPEQMPGAFHETPPVSAQPTPQPQPESARDPMDDRPPTASGPPLPPPVLPDERPSTSGADSLDGAANTDSDEAHRPGLGPMIKKKADTARPELSSKFRSAAKAYNAFKPRAGGAGERLAKETNGDGPDGINAVVPAPLRKATVDEPKLEPPAPLTLVTTPPTTADAAAIAEVSSPTTMSVREEPSQTGSEAPRVEISQHGQEGVELQDVGPVLQKVESAQSSQSEVQMPPTPEPRRPKRRSANQENYLRSLDVDPRLLDGRGVAFESILTDFGWGANILKGRQLEDLEADLKRELGRVEAGSWLGHLEQKDDRVEVVDQMLDRAIAECDELEGLLTLYAVELGSLNDDIAYIEAQSQGLQVQTANQKILHAELSKLVDTISLSRNELQPLRHGDLSTSQGLSEIESSLLLLYKAMVTIDPSIRSQNGLAASYISRGNGLEGTAIASMQALQEKRQAYLQESTAFCQRVLRHLDTIFDATLQRAKPALRSSNTPSASPLKLNGPAYNQARENLWQYSPLILFTKEINQQAWEGLFRMYQSKARPLYSEVFRGNAESWRKGVRKNTGEAAELLFTSSVEKEPSEGLSSTARRITVKRSQTLAKFRAASGDKPANTNDVRQAQAGRLMPCEVFAGVLEEQIPLVGMEQNFIVGLFHATSLDTVDFADAVMAATPAARISPDLGARRLMEPDRNVARRVSDIMEELFGFWSTEMKTLMEWAVAEDPIQGVGILTTLAIQSSQFQETSQEYALHNLTSLSQRLATLFQKFVDDQIRAIEDTKVKIKKRKGVIAFMKIFPPFAGAVENVYHGAAGRLDGTPAVAAARHMIDEAYVRINKAMWDSLKVIARESPTATAITAAQGVDPEDKEILNYHILLIENMHHYIEEVDDGGKEGSVLAEWKGKALMDRAEHMEEYVIRVVRRPLGKIMDFLEATETLLSQNMSGPSIAARPSYSRSTTKKLLAAHDSKEIRRSIETLRKRIEKHFGESDEEQLSRQLVVMVCKECERRYEHILDSLQRVCKELYKEEEKSVVIDWTKEDIRSGFKM